MSRGSPDAALARLESHDVQQCGSGNWRGQFAQATDLIGCHVLTGLRGGEVPLRLRHCFLGGALGFDRGFPLGAGLGLLVLRLLETAPVGCRRLFDLLPVPFDQLLDLVGGLVVGTFQFTVTSE